MDTIRELILKRLEEKRLTMSEVSALIGRNTSYLQQFLKRGVPVELHERDRRRLAEVLEVSEDILRGTSTALPPRPYRNNHSSALRNMRDHLPVQNSGENFLEHRRQSGIIHADLPVYGSIANNDGTFSLTKHPVGRTVRPDILANNDDAYAVIIPDDSMEPVIPLGSRVFVDPHSPCRSGDYCILRKLNEGGSDTFITAQFVRMTRHTIIVHQFNPKADKTLQRSEWSVCHNIPGLLFRR